MTASQLFTLERATLQHLRPIDQLAPPPNFVDGHVTATPINGTVQVATDDGLTGAAFYFTSDTAALTIGASILVLILAGTLRVQGVYATPPATDGGD